VGCGARAQRAGALRARALGSLRGLCRVRLLCVLDSAAGPGPQERTRTSPRRGGGSLVGINLRGHSKPHTLPYR
jgi:hypothetical protein